MRLLNVILTALAAVFALVAGLVVAALIAIVGSAFVALKRFRRPAVAAAPPRPTWNSARETDVIDVTATEVVAERVAGPVQS